MGKKVTIFRYFLETKGTKKKEKKRGDNYVQRTKS